MKKANFLFLFFVLLLSSYGSRAQNSKIGYVNYQVVYDQIPETAAAEKGIRNLEEKIQVELRQRQNQLYQQIEANPGSAAAEVKPVSSSRSTETAASFYEYAMQKQQELMKHKQDIYKSIEGKIKNAVKLVAAENGYGSIVDAGSMLYYPAENDLTAAVIKKLLSN